MSSEDCSQFIDSMLRLLPRIYICASDLASGMADDGMEADDVYIESVLDEDYYDTVRRNVENLLGPDDTYLEVFHQDMKYSCLLYTSDAADEY